jgi:energy-coupling factor transporter ATP-binding protein EcfA2
MLKNPFKLLDSYSKEDKDRFFGRNKEIAQLFNAVQASNLVMVYGASGTGKTSLINCGLGNKFQTSDWLPIFVRRHNNINQSLLRELDKRFDTLANFDPSQPVRHLVRTLYLDHYRPLYLIFDQFEELYIMGSKQEQKHFHRTISDLLQAGLQCKMLFIIREEYLAYLADFEKAVPSLFDNRLRIEKMNNRNLSKVVMGTARYGDIQVENPRTTVPAILDNLRSKREGIDLTNLQVYMDRLWRKDIERQGGDESRIEQVTFDPALVAAVGPMQNVLSEFLDEQMAEVEAGLRQRGMEKPEGIPLEILFTLVTEDGTKRNRELAEILGDLPKNRNISEAHVEYCMDKFHEIKLLRSFAGD